MPNLRAENRALLQLIEGIRSDLLMRGKLDPDGIRVVELSNGLWKRINDVLNGQVPDSAGKPPARHRKLPEHHKQWFSQLQKASSDGNLALMSSCDSTTMEPRSVIALVSHINGEFQLTPIGHLSEAPNPFEAYLPPMEDQKEEIIR